MSFANDENEKVPSPLPESRLEDLHAFAAEDFSISQLELNLRSLFEPAQKLLRNQGMAPYTPDGAYDIDTMLLQIERWATTAHSHLERHAPESITPDILRGYVLSQLFVPTTRLEERVVAYDSASRLMGGEFAMHYHAGLFGIPGGVSLSEPLEVSFESLDFYREHMEFMKEQFSRIKNPLLRNLATHSRWDIATHTALTSYESAEKFLDDLWDSLHSTYHDTDPDVATHLTTFLFDLSSFLQESNEDDAASCISSLQSELDLSQTVDMRDLLQILLESHPSEATPQSYDLSALAHPEIVEIGLTEGSFGYNSALHQKELAIITLIHAGTPSSLIQDLISTIAAQRNPSYVDYIPLAERYVLAASSGMSPRILNGLEEVSIPVKIQFLGYAIDVNDQNLQDTSERVNAAKRDVLILEGYKTSSDSRAVEAEQVDYLATLYSEFPRMQRLATLCSELDSYDPERTYLDGMGKLDVATRELYVEALLFCRDKYPYPLEDGFKEEFIDPLRAALLEAQSDEDKQMHALSTICDRVSEDYFSSTTVSQ